MTALDYAVVLEPLPPEEGGGYFATVPDLPGCASDGETPEAALANVADAIEAWKEGAEELGRPIPPPSRSTTQPELPQIRLPRLPLVA